MTTQNANPPGVLTDEAVWLKGIDSLRALIASDEVRRDRDRPEYQEVLLEARSAIDAITTAALQRPLAQSGAGPHDVTAKEYADIFEDEAVIIIGVYENEVRRFSGEERKTLATILRQSAAPDAEAVAKELLWHANNGPSVDKDTRLLAIVPKTTLRKAAALLQSSPSVQPSQRSKKLQEWIDNYPGDPEALADALAEIEPVRPPQGVTVTEEMVERAWKHLKDSEWGLIATRGAIRATLKAALEAARVQQFRRISAAARRGMGHHRSGDLHL